MASTTTSLSPWSPLRVSLFRGLWLAGVVSNVGTFMHTVAAGWAITSLTTSPTLVGLLQASWTVPGFLLALLAGALADVVDRRRLIILTQVVSAGIACALGVLALTDRLTVPLLLLLTFLLSTFGTLVAPTFMAITPELVDRSELPKAIALNSISLNAAQAVGPAVAGAVIAAGGPGAVFLVNAASFAGIVVVVRSYRPPVDASAPAESVTAAMGTGVRFIRNSPQLRRLAVRLALALFVTSSLTALLPVIARSKLRATAGEFGLLSAAMGVGALGAVWVLPRIQRRLTADAVACGAGVCWAVGAAMFATASGIGVAMVGLALCGAGSMATLNVIFSMYQTQLPALMRGRASSVAMLVIWLGASAGAVVWGALGSGVGVRRALVTAAAVHLVVTALASVFVPLGRNAVADPGDDPMPAPPTSGAAVDASNRQASTS